MKTLAASLIFLSITATSSAQEPDRSGLFEWLATLQQRITDNWVRPPADPDTPGSCHIHLTLSPAGAVESAVLKEPCGSAAFDQSIRDAVQRSSPMPLPKDPSAFHRKMVLNFQAR